MGPAEPRRTVEELEVHCLRAKNITEFHIKTTESQHRPSTDLPVREERREKDESWRRDDYLARRIVAPMAEHRERSAGTFVRERGSGGLLRGLGR